MSEGLCVYLPKKMVICKICWSPVLFLWEERCFLGLSCPWKYPALYSQARLGAKGACIGGSISCQYNVNRTGMGALQVTMCAPSLCSLPLTSGWVQRLLRL